MTMSFRSRTRSRSGVMARGCTVTHADRIAVTLVCFQVYLTYLQDPAWKARSVNNSSTTPLGSPRDSASLSSKLFAMSARIEDIECVRLTLERIMLTQLFLRSVIQSRFSTLSSRIRQEHCEKPGYYQPRSNPGRVTEVQFICGRKGMWIKQSSMCCWVRIMNSRLIEPGH